MEKERCQEPAGNRRMFLKAVGSIGLGTAALSSEATASPESKGDLGVKKGDNIKERIRESDPQKLYDYYANKYSPEIAKKVREIWKRYTQAILNGQLRVDVAKAKAFNELMGVSPELRRDLEAARAERSTIDENSTNTTPSVDRRQTNRVSTESYTTPGEMFSGELLLIDGNVGGSGVGYRDSHYYLEDNILTSIVEIVAIGSITQWAELTGNFYIAQGDGGTYRATANYWHNGMLISGSATYDMWIHPRNSSSKTFFNFQSPGASVYGNESRSVQLSLSSDTVYDFGFRLTTSINGITEALVDYQTINADGSTRQFRLDSLRLDPV